MVAIPFVFKLLTSSIILQKYAPKLLSSISPAALGGGLAPWLICGGIFMQMADLFVVKPFKDIIKSSKEIDEKRKLPWYFENFVELKRSNTTENRSITINNYGVSDPKTLTDQIMDQIFAKGEIGVPTINNL